MTAHEMGQQERLIEFGHDWSRRTEVAIQGLDRFDPELMKLFLVWKHARENSPASLPRREDLGPEVLARIGMIGRIHMVDVSSMDPARFRYRLYGTTVAQMKSHDHTGLMLGDFPNRLHVSTLMEDYNTAKVTGVPLVQKVDAMFDFSRRDYKRLILPLVDGPSDTPNRLLVGVSLPHA